MEEKRCIFVGFWLIVLVSVVASFPSEEIKHQEVQNDEPKESKEPTCGTLTPCGWSVYTRFTRSFNYFMKNKCHCPEKTSCQKAEDDISIDAFVYRCSKRK